MRIERGRTDGTTAVGRQTVVADDTAFLMHHENGSEPPLLIGQGARFQPVIERRLATRELRDIVRARAAGNG